MSHAIPDPIFSSRRTPLRVIASKPRRGPEPDYPAPERPEIDLRQTLAIIWRGRIMILGLAIMMLAVAWAALARLEPQFKATAMVMFDARKAQVVDLQQVLTDPEYSKDQLQNEIAVLQSTALLERVVATLALDRNPEFNPALRAQSDSLLQRIGARIQLPERLRALLASGDTPPATDARDRQRLAILAHLRRNLVLEPLSSSRIIEISFTSTDRETAKNVVNAVTEQYLVDQLEAKLELTRSATNWLSGRVTEMRQSVQGAEETVEQLRAEMAVQAGQSRDISQKQLDSLTADLALERREGAHLASRVDGLNQALAVSQDVGAVPELRRSEMLQTLREKEISLSTQLANLSDAVPASHPARLRVTRQLGDVDTQIRAETKRILAAAEQELAASRARQADLVGAIKGLEQKIFEQARQEVTLRQAEREAEARRLLYENFLARFKETSEQVELQTADARVLSAAERPTRPERRKEILILSLAAGAGVLIGLAVVFLRESLSNTFRTPQELEDVTGRPALSALPTLGRYQSRARILRHMTSRPNSPLSEAIRSLRTSLLFAPGTAPPKVVMFTSSVPREGKSTTATLLAMASQQMGRSSIIVDCDLRLPTLAQIAGRTSGNHGLVSVLEGLTPWTEAVHTDPKTGLDMLMVRDGEMPSGHNPGDILSGPAFRDLIAELSAAYEFVILDTPPVLAVSDARVLARLTDAVVYCVRWNKTTRGSVAQGLKELRSVDAPVTGLVLTMMHAARAERYAYGGYTYDKRRYRGYYA